MSTQTVRNGIAAWLTGVTGINTVMPSMHSVITEKDYFAGQVGATFGAVAYVHIPTDNEKRIAFGGPISGKKRIDYQVEIHVLFMSTASPTVGQDQTGVAMDTFEDLIDNLKTRIRADRTANGAVWEWGETLTSVKGEPAQLGGGGIQIWGAISTQATEWITS